MCSAVAYEACPTPPVAALPFGLGSPCDWAPWYGSSNCITASQRLRRQCIKPSSTAPTLSLNSGALISAGGAHRGPCATILREQVLKMRS
jgi:hypothetical protein